jgi:ubiquitin-like protein Nedd8
MVRTASYVKNCEIMEVRPTEKRISTARSVSDSGESDLTAIKERLEQKEKIRLHLVRIGEELLVLSLKEASDLAVEYLRFIHLKVVIDVDDQPSTLAPSPDIDSLWHQHLLDTRSYKEMERLLLPNGKFIHHNPFKKDQPNYQGRLENTRMHYQDFFHSAPPTDIWGINISEMESKVIQDVKKQRAAYKTAVGDAIAIDVKMMTGKFRTIVVPLNATVADLKKVIEVVENVTPEQQRLVIDGRKLEDDRRLKDYNIGTGSIVHMVLNLRGC